MEAVTTEEKLPERKIVWTVLGSIFMVILLLYGIFLPFLECGMILLDCYFVPLPLYYLLMLVPALHFLAAWWIVIIQYGKRPLWFKRFSFYHTGITLFSAAVYLGYHFVHPGWHETAKGFSLRYTLLKPWHQVLGEEMVFPFLFATTLFFFFHPRVQWWLKPLMLIGIGLLILVP